jgi:hypothetical protein
MVTEQNTAAQVARLREMAGKFKNHADLNRDDALSVRNGHVLRMYVEELDGYASDVSAAADALEREAGLVAALLRIKASDNEADADGLIDDTTCCCCDANSADGCDEDCPRAIAAEALDAARGGK